MNGRNKQGNGIQTATCQSHRGNGIVFMRLGVVLKLFGCWANSTLTNKYVDLCLSALTGDIFEVWRLEVDTNVALSQMKA